MNVVFYNDTHTIDLGGDVSRRILAYDDSIMAVEVAMQTGGIGAAHKHPHAQCTYILSGAFEFTVDGEKAIVRKGDTMTFPASVVHSTVCLEAGVILDIFSPLREDFIK